MLCLVVAALGLGAGATAAASARQPALDQYVPSLPGATGNQAPRPGAGGRPALLAPAVRTRLSRQRDGALLLRIASAPGLGAPPAAQQRRGDSDRDGRAAAPPAGSATAAVRDVAGEPVVLALLAGMLLSACALLGLVLAQRRGQLIRRAEQ